MVPWNLILELINTRLCPQLPGMIIVLLKYMMYRSQDQEDNFTLCKTSAVNPVDQNRTVTLNPFMDELLFLTDNIPSALSSWVTDDDAVWLLSHEVLQRVFGENVGCWICLMVEDNFLRPIHDKNSTSFWEKHLRECSGLRPCCLYQRLCSQIVPTRK